MKKLWDFCWGMYKKYEEGINYLIFGFIAFVLNYVLYVIFSYLTDLCGLHSTVYATAISWLLTVFFAYWTNRTFVFKSKNKDRSSVWKEMASFIGARAVTGVLEIIMMFLSVDCAHLNEYICKLVCQTLVIVANYFLSTLCIFTEKNQRKNVAKNVKKTTGEF